MTAVEMLVDERGDLLRAAVRGESGTVDLSLWRDDRCRATFRLDPTDAARLAHLLVTALAERHDPPDALLARHDVSLNADCRSAKVSVQ